MQLPHAEEIGQLRAIVERGDQARQDLTELEPALTMLSLGSGNDRAEALLERLRQRWQEFDLAGDTHEALAAARRHLHGLILQSERNRAKLHQLQHHQLAHLNQEGYAEIREELAELGAQRAAISASLQPLHSTVAVLSPMLSVLRKQLLLAESDLTDGLPDRADARLAQILAGLQSLLAQQRLEVEVNATGDGRATMRALASALDRVDALVTGMAVERDSLSTQLAELEERSRARTG